jgi:ribokinase
VTLGSAGVLLVARDGDATRSIAIPAWQVTAVDTTGAGDAFNGALAVGLAAGLSLEAATRRAVIAAGLATTKSGAREGMPNVDELEQALRRSGRG